MIGENLIIYGGIIEDDAETNEIWIFNYNQKSFSLFKNPKNISCNYLIEFLYN